jgi:hypothetical protein
MSLQSFSPAAFDDLWETDKSEMPSCGDPAVQFFIMKLLFSEDFKNFTQQMESMLSNMKGRIP